MIAAVTGREVPPPPGLPIDVGAVVCNVSTTVAVYDAVQKNKPLIERVVTVTGRQVEAPKNLLVRFGTPVAVLLEAAGGVPAGDVKVLNGGPMMGRAMSNLASPVVKGCSGITVLGGGGSPAWSGELLYQMRQMRVGLPDGIGALSDGQTLAPQAVGAARSGVGDQLHRVRLLSVYLSGGYSAAGLYPNGKTGGRGVDPCPRRRPCNQEIRKKR